ncbi:GMC oxidoreductase, partial [Sphaerobolus stellatus SS14]
GGGTAGCILANRLSEDDDVSVLILGRGRPSFSWSSCASLLSAKFQSDSERSLKFTSLPQTQVGNRSIEIAVGNTLGGTSRINDMLYTRGILAQFNAWAAQERKGWSYDDIFPYFFKPECALDETRSNVVHNTTRYIIY